MKTFAVIGLGRFGTAVAKKLFFMGYEVLALDVDTEKTNYIAPYVTQAVAGDLKDENVLKAVGIRNYDCVVVAITENLSDSILITLQLKEMGVGQIVCKAQDENHKKILEKIGADSVIIPEYEVGVKTAVNLVSKNFVDIMELSSKYSIVDMTVPKKWIGKSIISLDVRRKHNINIIAVKDGENIENILIGPAPDYVFKENDILVVVGETESIHMLNRE